MMAHIRYATQGIVSLENVHPFQREMWGIQWTFCHNGEVTKYSGEYADHPQLGKSHGETSEITTGGRDSDASNPITLEKSKYCSHLNTSKSFPNLRKAYSKSSIDNGRDPNKDSGAFYLPVGDTDSEATFCAILNALRGEYTELPTLPLLYESIQRLCSEIIEGDEESSILNFLLGCGQYTMFAYSWPGSRPGSTVWNGLHYTIRKPPFSTARLADIDYSLDFASCTKPSDRVAVIATAPLTVDEKWVEFKRGELLMFDDGLAFSELYDCHEVEKRGRGLESRVLPKSFSNKDVYLAYDAPSLLRRLVDAAVSEEMEIAPKLEPGSGGRLSDKVDEGWADRGADLGCGAGCSGVAFRSCARHLTGVDLSPAMVDKALERGCYDELVVGNIESILRREGRQENTASDTEEPAALLNQQQVSRNGNWSKRSSPCKLNDCSTFDLEDKFDLIFACNVFSYIKHLRSVFQSIRSSLNDDGVFAFSAEILEDVFGDDKVDPDPDKPYALQKNARYAHKKGHLQSLAEEFGFRTLRFEASPLRKHDGRDVKGVLAVFAV